MIPSKLWKVAALAALLLLFVLSLNSLKSFPHPFQDEGDYAAYGFNYVKTGKFLVQTEGSVPAVLIDGDVIHSRINSILFGYLGSSTGYSLATMRFISFAWVWFSVVLFFFISRWIGVSGLLGALLFASTERIFYSSHVFRPESTLVFVNTFFLFLLLNPAFQASKKLALGRGLLNGAFVLAHGNGLVTCLINSFDFLLKSFRERREFWFQIFFYSLGGISALALFYFVQISDAGTWRAFVSQMKEASQYMPKGSLLDTMWRDFTVRWWLELVFVGGSVAGRALRWLYYGIVLFCTCGLIWRGLSKRDPLGLRLGSFSLSIFLGYVFLVSDKVDIHIAEMSPFFVAAILAFSIRASSRLEIFSGRLALAGAISASLALSIHHAVKYRHEAEFTLAPVHAVHAYLERRPEDEKHDSLMFIGNMQYWAHFRSLGTFIGNRHYQQVLPLRGKVIAVGADSALLAPLSLCKRIHADPGNLFVTFNCD